MSSRFVHGVVTGSGVRPLATQKPIKRPGWWKGRFALFCRPAAGVGGRGDEHLSKGRLPPLTTRGQELLQTAFILPAETAQAALTVTMNLVIGGLTNVILIVLGTVNLQFHVRFVSISLRPVFRIVAASVMATVWSSWS